MEEKELKKLKVAYFKEDGKIYRLEEEYTIGLFVEEDIVNKILGRLRYSKMDVVVFDGGDNVRPYVKPYLKKYDKNRSISKGF